MRYLALIFLIVACNNASQHSDSLRVDSLTKLNDSLNNQLKKAVQKNLATEELEVSKSNYCYVLITYINREMGSGLQGLQDVTYLTWSDITEVSKFNEDVKYRLMDEFEKKFLANPPAYFKKIIKRECFFFDSYVEASKHLASRKSL